MAPKKSKPRKEINYFLQVAKEAAINSGEWLRRNLERRWRVDYKGVVNLVTDCDRRSQEIILSRLERAFPEHGWLAEEDKSRPAGEDGYRWLVDPLDGTTNFTHHFPIFCVSIALERAGEILLGVVYDPMRREIFQAIRGQGAYLNGKRIKVSKTALLNRSLLATGFPYDLRESPVNNLIHFENFLFRCQAIRRCGAAALDLSYVACGRFDGFWELKLNPWDVAAGALLVQEAGGQVSHFQGQEFNLNSSDIVASNGFIHRAMLRVLALGLRVKKKKKAG